MKTQYFSKMKASLHLQIQLATRICRFKIFLKFAYFNKSWCFFILIILILIKRENYNISTIINLIIWFLGEVNLLLHKSLFVTHIDIEVCRNIYSLWGGFEVFLLSMVLGFTVTSPSYVRISFKSMDWKDLFISFDDKWTQHHSMVYFYPSYWLSILLYHYTKT